jgi:Fic family protein
MADFNAPESHNNLTPDEQEYLHRVKDLYFNKIKDIMGYELIDHALIFPETESLPELLGQLTELKKCIMSFRPLSPEHLQNLTEVFDIEYTYESNRIEGNTLSLRETSFVINEGLTIRDKSLREHLEAINHQEAINYIREVIADDAPFDERSLKNIHALILHGIDRMSAGSYRSVPVGISGTDIVFPQPFRLQNLMEEFFRFYEENKESMHPAELAAEMHERLVNIHPFIDGNGRTSRLIMNLFLLKAGFPLTIISSDEKNRNIYFDALNQARDESNPEAFKIFIAQNVKKWCFRYLDMLAPSIGEENKNKGYYYFKKIGLYLK